MLANVFFRDIFAHEAGGILPQAVATGTTSGTAVQLGGLGPLGKQLIRFITTNASAAASISMYLETATASAGAYTSISQTLVSAALVASSTSALQVTLVLDTRNEAFANLATASGAPKWFHVVLVISGAALTGALDVLGWEAGNDPAKNYDAASTAVQLAETDFY
jgi:hypothetical protein